VPSLFFFFFVSKEPYWLAHHQFFQNIGHSSIEVPIWTPSCKLETNADPLCLPFQFIYWRVELGQTIWDKTEVLLGTSWKLEEPHGNTLGTKGGKKKSSHPTLLSPPPQKKKNMSACWAFTLAAWRNFYFQTVCHHFWPGLMAGARTVGHIVLRFKCIIRG
jgi:hypothetical protein